MRNIIKLLYKNHEYGVYVKIRAKAKIKILKTAIFSRKLHSFL